MAYRAQEGDPDSLILLLEGIKEQSTLTDVFILIQSAIDEVIRLGSFYTDLRNDYLRILIRKYRQTYSVKSRKSSILALDMLSALGE